MTSLTKPIDSQNVNEHPCTTRAYHIIGCYVLACYIVAFIPLNEGKQFPSIPSLRDPHPHSHSTTQEPNIMNYQGSSKTIEGKNMRT